MTETRKDEEFIRTERTPLFLVPEDVVQVDQELQVVDPSTPDLFDEVLDLVDGKPDREVPASLQPKQ